MYLAIVQTQAPRSFTDAEFYESHDVHFGCEIIARTIGEQREGSLYEGVDKREKIEEAVSVAVNSITGDAPFFRRD